MTTDITSKRLPLHEEHLSRGARMGDFGGWNVPLYYTSIIEEHVTVRTQVGIFDISHMGEFLVEGPGALAYLERCLPRKIAPVKNQQAIYMPLVNERGGMVDDIILYRVKDDRFLIIVNAGNIEKDYKWFLSRVTDGVTLMDLSSEYGLLAVQGPASSVIIATAFGAFFRDIPRFQYRDFEGGIMARTGYTGEDGFEIMVPTARLKSVWDVLFMAGEKKGLKPVGFGARDTLRLEAGMPLYGHELTDEITPLEAGLGWALDFEKSAFPGSEILRSQKNTGVQRKRIGFEMVDRGIPRHACEIHKDGKQIGWVTSGSFIPPAGTTPGRNIGMGYVSSAEARENNEIDIVVRGHSLKARVVSLPFYKRK
ncbi:MAG TPA: glycine cleavage system aminomethyltransferase GcvT [Candidatus Omnitrophota bacterium]|nr:glycine cleavage system aminomethyltransferase GcvT [Candidatus Omnitrophota bacterium]HQB11555.1 glycine cleavage system aminomethyltransferase GcvT [Candidatus Omnitrophota bacterium]